MRKLRSSAVSVAPLAITAFALLSGLAAQEPTPAPTPATPPEEAPAAQPAERGNRPRRGRAPLVIEAGTVHPVSGPSIENGVVVIRGERILAIGKKGEVDVPENATVRSFPTGHLYPGLVDALTDAYTDGSLRGDGGADGGTSFADDLRAQNARSDALAAAGITTAYVAVRSPALVRGQGAIVRPRRDGFEPWAGKERAALQLRLTDGPAPSHALQRQQQQQAAMALFEGLDDFQKARTDHDEALKKYEKEFADYLAWHQKKKDAGATGGDKPAEPPKAGETPPPAEGSRPPGARPGRGNRGGGGGGGGEPPKNDPPKAPGTGEVSDEQFEQALATLLEAIAQDPPKQDPPKQDPVKTDAPPAGGAQGPATPPAAEKKDEAPKRPTFPKAPPPDPQREALRKVVDGELPLRVEAHRPDELRAALRLQREHKLPVLVLEFAHGAGAVAGEIAAAGASVVLTDCLPGRLDPPYDSFDLAALPNALHGAGVPFAIASGRAMHAPMLPLFAAAAVGAGLPADQALRAITLTPAEILGVAKDTGSLQPGKFADVLVTDRPLFQSDSRTLLVLGKGRTEFEVQ